MSEALHLYCVVGDGMELDLGPIGLDGHRVSIIHHRDFAALVSPTPIRAYKSMKREEIVPYLFAHQTVIEQVMKGHTVIPVKFGTIARHEGEVRKILERGCPLLKDALEAMEGRIELDLVAQWKDLGSVFRQVGEEPEVRRQKVAIASRPPVETREERIQIGRLVKARLDQMRQERAVEIVEALKPLARDLCSHALLDDGMILNVAVLVDRAGEGKVSETLEWLNERYGDSIDFRCVGPLPPYSFATVEVRTFEFESINRARSLLALPENAGVAEVRNAYRRLVQECHPDHPARHETETGWTASGQFQVVTEASRLLEEYCQVGSTFRAPDVRDAVAVRLLQWSRESKGIP